MLRRNTRPRLGVLPVAVSVVVLLLCTGTEGISTNAVYLDSLCKLPGSPACDDITFRVSNFDWNGSHWIKWEFPDGDVFTAAGKFSTWWNGQRFLYSTPPFYEAPGPLTVRTRPCEPQSDCSSSYYDYEWQEYRTPTSVNALVTDIEFPALGDAQFAVDKTWDTTNVKCHWTGHITGTYPAVSTSSETDIVSCSLNPTGGAGTTILTSATVAISLTDGSGVSSDTATINFVAPLPVLSSIDVDTIYVDAIPASVSVTGSFFYPSTGQMSCQIEDPNGGSSIISAPLAGGGASLTICSLPTTTSQASNIEVRVRNSVAQSYQPSSGGFTVDYVYPPLSIAPNNQNLGDLTLPLNQQIVIDVDRPWDDTANGQNPECQITYTLAPAGTITVPATPNVGAGTFTITVPTRTCSSCAESFVVVRCRNHDDQDYSTTQALFNVVFPNPTLTSGTLASTGGTELLVGFSDTVILAGTDFYDSVFLSCEFTPIGSSLASTSTISATYINATHAECAVPIAPEPLVWEVRASARNPAVYIGSPVTIEVLWNSPDISTDLGSLSNQWLSASPSSDCPANAAAVAKTIELFPANPAFPLVNNAQTDTKCIWDTLEGTFTTNATYNAGAGTYFCPLDEASITTHQVAQLSLTYDINANSSDSVSVYLFKDLDGFGGATSAPMPGSLTVSSLSSQFLSDAPYELAPSTPGARDGLGLTCEVQYSVDNGTTTDIISSAGSWLNTDSIVCDIPFIAALDPLEFNVAVSPDGCSYSSTLFNYEVGTVVLPLNSISPRNWEYATEEDIPVGHTQLDECQTLDWGNPAPVGYESDSCLYAELPSGIPAAVSSAPLCALEVPGSGVLNTFPPVFYGNAIGANVAFGCNFNTSTLPSLPAGAYNFRLESFADGARSGSNPTPFYLVSTPEPLSLDLNRAPIGVAQPTSVSVNNTSLQRNHVYQPAPPTAINLSPWYRWTGSDPACDVPATVCGGISAEACDVITPALSSVGNCTLELSNNGLSWVEADTFFWNDLPVISAIAAENGGPYVTFNGLSIDFVITGTGFDESFATVNLTCVDGSCLGTELILPCNFVNASRCDFSVALGLGLYEVSLSNAPAYGAYSNIEQVAVIPPPSLASISPSSANPVGINSTDVVLTLGAGSIPPTGYPFAAVCRVNGGEPFPAAAVSDAASAEVTCTLASPAVPIVGGSSTEQVSVAVDGGFVFTATRAFTWSQTPTILAIDPPIGYQSGGIVATVTLDTNPLTGVFAFRFFRRDINLPSTAVNLGDISTATTVNPGNPEWYDVTLVLPAHPIAPVYMQISINEQETWSSNDTSAFMDILRDPQPTLQAVEGVNLWWPDANLASNPYPPSCFAFCDDLNAVTCCSVTVYAPEFENAPSSRAYVQIRETWYEASFGASAPPGDTSVLIGGYPAPIRRNFDFPATGVGEAATILFSNDKRDGNPFVFQFHDRPIVALSPDSGPREGGTSITMTGNLPYTPPPWSLALNNTHLATDYKLRFGVSGTVIAADSAAPGAVTFTSPTAISPGVFDVYISINGRDFLNSFSTFEFEGSGDLELETQIDPVLLVTLVGSGALAGVCVLVGMSVVLVKKFGQRPPQEDEDEEKKDDEEKEGLVDGKAKKSGAAGKQAPATPAPPAGKPSKVKFKSKKEAQDHAKREAEKAKKRADLLARRSMLGGLISGAVAAADDAAAPGMLGSVSSKDGKKKELDISDNESMGLYSEASDGVSTSSQSTTRSASRPRKGSSARKPPPGGPRSPGSARKAAPGGPRSPGSARKAPPQAPRTPQSNARKVPAPPKVPDDDSRGVSVADIVDDNSLAARLAAHRAKKAPGSAPPEPKARPLSAFPAGDPSEKARPISALPPGDPSEKARPISALPPGDPSEKARPISAFPPGDPDEKARPISAFPPGDPVSTSKRPVSAFPAGDPSQDVSALAITLPGAGGSTNTGGSSSNRRRSSSSRSSSKKKRSSVSSTEPARPVSVFPPGEEPDAKPRPISAFAPGDPSAKARPISAFAPGDPSAGAATLPPPPIPDAEAVTLDTADDDDLMARLAKHAASKK